LSYGNYQFRYGQQPNGYAKLKLILDLDRYGFLQKEFYSSFHRKRNRIPLDRRGGLWSPKPIATIVLKLRQYSRRY